MADKILKRCVHPKVFVMMSPKQSLRDTTGQAVGSHLRKRELVFVAMSGGVDSSVAAFLLKESGKYDVVGAFIKGYNIDGCQKKEAEDARRAAEFLNIPFYVIDLEKDYKKLVVDYMIDGYKKGITPNPDVMCNKEIKFGLFLKKALEMGADFVATGHYVKLAKSKWPASPKLQRGEPASPKLPLRQRSEASQRGEQRANDKIKKPFAISYSLFAARDAQKDQSYFLWTLTQEQLKHCLFPIGDYLKSEVRQIAKKAGLPSAEKKDSQGICFLGQVSMKDFLKERIKMRKGDIINTEGKKIGNHDGVWFYTIGQRHIGIANRGLTRTGRGTTQNKNFKPLYVADKDLEKNILVMAEGEDNPELFKKEIEIIDVSFINSNIPSLIRANKGINVLARVRYRQPLFKALFIIHNSSFKLLFEEKQRFVASGQSAVFYNVKGEMLGGGVIK